jgi:YbgC/YbaW family acyl-CoA thioester hydrolase
MQVINAHGWTAPRMIEAGFGIVVRRHQIEYKQSALLDEELEISTWVSGVRRATATRHYTIHRVRDGALLAQVHSYCVWIDLKTGQPVRISPGFISAFAPNIVSASVIARSPEGATKQSARASDESASPPAAAHNDT